jgi:aminopeptidase N
VLADLHASFDGRPEQRERLDRYARARLAPVLARLGWTPAADEAGPVAKLREELIKALSAVGDPQVIAEARRRYALSVTHTGNAGNPGNADATAANPMPAALRRAILGVVAAHADAATWEQLRAAARQEKSAMVKTELYELLGTAADPALARQALALAISEEPDATSGAAIVSRVAERHPDMAFDFALAHREQIEAKVDASSRSRYFARLGRHSADPAMVGKLRAYAERHLAAVARGDADSAIAAVEYRVKVRDTRLPEIERWLIKQKIRQEK